MSSVDTNYLMVLCDDDNGFSGLSSLEIMYYLYTNHGNIEYEYLVTNKHRLTNSFDSPQPIFNLFNRYNYISTLSTKVGQPISAQDKLSLAYVFLKTSYAYDRAVGDWDDMTAAQKKWALFKTYFITAYRKLNKQIKGQVKNMMKGGIPALIANELQKFSTQFDEGQQKLANFFEAN